MGVHLRSLMLRTLREDIPCTLQRSPNMDIFADNIAFTDNISPRMGHQTNVVQGTEAYSRQLWSLRFHAALLFSKSHVGSRPQDGLLSIVLGVNPAQPSPFTKHMHLQESGTALYCLEHCSTSCILPVRFVSSLQCASLIHSHTLAEVFFLIAEH